MLLTENASKAGLKQEQCQDTQLPAGTALSQESLPLVFSAWKSTEVSRFPLPQRHTATHSRPGDSTHELPTAPQVRILTPVSLGRSQGVCRLLPRRGPGGQPLCHFLQLLLPGELSLSLNLVSLCLLLYRILNMSKIKLSKFSFMVCAF